VSILKGIDEAIEWSHAYRPRPTPLLVLPDHWQTSEVMRAVELAGAVTYRGQTVTSETDIRGMEGPR